MTWQQDFFVVNGALAFDYIFELFSFEICFNDGDTDAINNIGFSFFLLCII